MDIKSMISEILREEIVKTLRGEVVKALQGTNSPEPVKPATAATPVYGHGYKDKRTGVRYYLTAEEILGVADQIEKGTTQKKIMKMYGISPMTLWRIVHREGRYGKVLADRDGLLNFVPRKKRTITDLETAAYILDDVKSGMSYEQVMEKYSISELTLSRIIAGMGRYSQLVKES